MAQTTSHPAAKAPDQDRIAYVRAVASIAWADRELDNVESLKLKELCAMLGLPTEVADQFVGEGGVPDFRDVESSLARFRDSGLHVALLSDVVLMTFADGRIAPGEAEEIARFAKALGLQTGQAVLISRYVEGVASGQSQEALARELADKLAALPGPVPHQSVLSGLMGRLRGRRS